MKSLLARLPIWLAGPLPFGLALLALLGLLLWAAGAAGLRWDPFGLDRRRLQAAETRIALAESHADARQAEAEGEREQARRLERTFEHVRAAEALTSTTIHEARTSDESQTPLRPERADRLRLHDGELCRLSPDLVGCTTTVDAS